MRCRSFHQLPPALRLFAMDKIDGGMADVVLDYDERTHTLRWWRLGAALGFDHASPKGSIALPVHLLGEAQKLVTDVRQPGETAEPPMA